MSYEEIISPCNQDCEMDQKTGYCRGCFRTTDEIMEWGFLTNKERKHFIETILPSRKKQNQSQ
jgi:predicted Fe-S protein YdhL (DUF1289 family)